MNRQRTLLVDVVSALVIVAFAYLASFWLPEVISLPVRLLLAGMFSVSAWFWLRSLRMLESLRDQPAVHHPPHHHHGA